MIIAEGLANAILVFRLINEYCYQLNKVRGKILFIELADAGLFDLSVTARDLSSWHCGFDAFAIAALDIEMKERANIVSPQRSFLAALSGTHRLLGDVPYSVGRDIVLVECSCSEDVLERAKGESAKSIGKNLQLWKQSNPEWRIPVVLEFGSTSVAFKGEPPKTDAEAVRRAGDLDKLINEIALIAGEHGIETNADPLKIANASDYRDGTLEACQADIDMYGACRVFSNLDETTWIPDPLPLRIAQRNVLIVCAQVALLQGPEERPGVPIYFPRVVKLVLASAYGRVLVYHVDMEDTGIYPEGYVDAQLGSRKEWRYMRSSILEYLGKNGILVGFGVSWVLTALQLALDATRVIEIGEEPAFQRWCRQLAVASKTPQLADHMTPNLKIPYDARWPAVLQPDPLDLAPEGRPDIFRFAFYTAAVWQIVRTRIAEDRARHDIFYARSLYKVGCGLGFLERDLIYLSEDQDLLLRPRAKLTRDTSTWPAVTDLATTPLDIISRVEEAPSFPVLWPGEHTKFIKQCLAMTQKWRDSIPPGDPFPRNFGNHTDRSQLAVDMSIGSMTVHIDAGLAVAWINHHHVFSCAQLAAVDPGSDKFKTVTGRNLIICCIDLAFQPAWFDCAMGPQPPRIDPRARPDEEMLKAMKADPLRGAPKFFHQKLAEVPPHFITPPPRRIRTPLPPLQKIPIIPRQVGEPKKKRKWIHPPGEFTSYGREAHTSEESQAEEVPAAAVPTTPEEIAAAELRAKGVKLTEALYKAQKKVREDNAKKKAAAEERAMSPPPAPSTPKPPEESQPQTPRRSPRGSPKKPSEKRAEK